MLASMRTVKFGRLNFFLIVSETQVQSQGSSYGICVEQVALGQGFSPSTTVSPACYPVQSGAGSSGNASVCSREVTGSPLGRDTGCPL